MAARLDTPLDEAGSRVREDGSEWVTTETGSRSSRQATVMALVRTIGSRVVFRAAGAADSRKKNEPGM